jgi:hypothetical protein
MPSFNFRLAGHENRRALPLYEDAKFALRSVIPRSWKSFFFSEAAVLRPVLRVSEG